MAESCVVAHMVSFQKEICLLHGADSPGQELLPPARVTTRSEIFYGTFIKVSEQMSIFSRGFGYLCFIGFQS